MINVEKTEIIESESDVKKDTDKKPLYKRWYIIVTAIICVVMMIFNYNYAIVFVNGNSMNPNYEHGNMVLAEKQYDNLYRFDVVVVNSKEANQIIIKRVIGLPGDKIEYKNNQLYVNGEFVEDIYGAGLTNEFTVEVTEGNYFCLGDNRENSYDSRKYGLFSENEIIAKVRGRRYVKIQTNPIY